MSDVVSMLGRSFPGAVSYGQSGNFVFDTELGKEDIVSAVESSFELEFGFGAFCVVRTFGELQKAVDDIPFSDVRGDRLFLMFMYDGVPDDEDAEWSYGDDVAERIGDIIYLSCKGEYHRTKLSNGFFERELGAICTARNLNTVNAVLRM